jgi:hypothetical protein
MIDLEGAHGLGELACYSHIAEKRPRRWRTCRRLLSQVARAEVSCPVAIAANAKQAISAGGADAGASNATHSRATVEAANAARALNSTAPDRNGACAAQAHHSNATVENGVAASRAPHSGCSVASNADAAGEAMDAVAAIANAKHALSGYAQAPHAG